MWHLACVLYSSDHVGRVSMLFGTSYHQLALGSGEVFMVIGGSILLKHPLASAWEPMEGHGDFIFFNFVSSLCLPSHLHPQAPRRMFKWSDQDYVPQRTGAVAATSSLRTAWSVMVNWLLERSFIPVGIQQ